MTVRAGIGALILALAAATAGFYAYHWWEVKSAPAPDLKFIDLDGKPHQLSEFRGKLLLVNFWASWCAPCMNELPLLVKAQTQFAARGLQIIGPAMDSREPVLETIKKFGVNYPVYGAEDEVNAAMDALGDALDVLPYSVLIGPDGKVLEQIAGGLSQARLDGLIGKYLGP